MTDPARSLAVAGQESHEPTHLDERAKAIIEQLQQDGRRSYSAIGRPWASPRRRCASG